MNEKNVHAVLGRDGVDDYSHRVQRADQRQHAQLHLAEAKVDADQ